MRRRLSLAIKEDLVAQGKAVALVDAGDFAQGAAYASMDQGASVMKFMNVAGYDLAALGNHEFDYGFERLFGIVKEAAFPIVSCNLIDVKGKPLDVAPYKVLKLGKTRVAFVGGLTPRNLFKRRLTAPRDIRTMSLFLATWALTPAPLLGAART